MAIRADSYSSAADVLALTRHLIEGQSTFNSTTRPTLTEVEGFIDEASGTLNMALRAEGFAPAAVAANSTATLACDMWVRSRAVAFVEFTHPTQGFLGDNEDRSNPVMGLAGSAQKFAKNNALGFKREGVTVADPSSQGLRLTGTTARADRADPDDTSLEQPFFSGKQFDNP